MAGLRRSLWRSFWRKRGRLLVWLVWPVLVFVVSISVIHFLRYRLGFDIYWTWSPGRALVAVLVALVVPAAYEMAVRRRQSDGGHRPSDSSLP